MLKLHVYCDLFMLFPKFIAKKVETQIKLNYQIMIINLIQVGSVVQCVNSAGFTVVGHLIQLEYPQVFV